MYHTIYSSSYHPPSVPFNMASLLYLYHPLPTFSPSMIHRKPSTSQPLPLVSVPRLECLVILLFPASVCTPFLTVLHYWSRHILFIPAYIPPRVVFCLLLYSGVWFILRWNCSYVKERAPDTSTPCQSLTPFLVLPRYLAMPVPGFMLQLVFSFSMLKAYMYLPWILWLYILIRHNSLCLHTESNWRLLTSSNLFSLHWGTRIRKLHSLKCINMEHWKYLLNLWGHVITW